MSDDDWKIWQHPEASAANTGSSLEKHCAQCGELIAPPNACIAVGRTMAQQAMSPAPWVTESIVVCSEECQQAYEVRQHVKGQDLMAAISAMTKQALSGTIGQPHTLITSEAIAKKLGDLINKAK